MKKSYIVAIDYRATYKPTTTDYKVLEADNLLDAMSEAESYLDTEKVYLLIIMQADKAGHKVKGMPGIRRTPTSSRSPIVAMAGTAPMPPTAKPLGAIPCGWTKARTHSTSTATKLLETHLMMTLWKGSKPFSSRHENGRGSHPQKGLIANDRYSNLQQP